MGELAKCLSDGLITRIYKQLLQLTNKKKIFSTGNEQTFIPSVKKIYGLQLCT